MTLPARCPFCESPLVATELTCYACDTTISGQFTLDRAAAFDAEQLPVLRRLAQLSPEQLRFVETFLSCEGKITRVEEELGISYPTVRARLNEVLRTLGFQPRGEEERERISQREALDRLEAGEISPEEALEMLRS